MNSWMFLPIILLLTWLQSTTNLPTVTIVCTAESKSIVEALTQTAVASAWLSEQMTGYCYQEILKRLERNLKMMRIDYKVLQISPEIGESFPNMNSLVLYTTMNANGASMVVLFPHFDTPELLPINFEPFRYDSVSLHVLNPNEKQGAADFATGLVTHFLGECGLADQYFEAANQVEWQWYSYTDNGPSDGPLIETLFFQGNCAAMSGLLENAENYYISANTPLVDFNLQNNVVFTYLLLGEPQKAIELATQVIEATQSYPDLYRKKAYQLRSQIYRFLNQPTEAIEDLTNAIKFYRWDPEPFILRGQLYRNIYEWDNSLADFNTAIELAPGYADSYYERGLLYYSVLQTGQELRQEALADFQRYLELAPEGKYATEAREYVESIELELAALNDE